MNNGKNIRVIIAGGGTGGHIFPGIAIAKAIKKKEQSADILFIGATGKMEMERVPASGFQIKGIDIAGYNRGSLLRNWNLPFKLVKSYLRVKNILREFRPDAVVGVGGYSSFPVLRAAQSMKIPTFIHESNTLPGKSNLILGKRAVAVFVASEGMDKYFSREKLILTGNPVRSDIVQPVDKKTALEYFGLSDEYKTLLVVGGSLGARSINEAVEAHLDFFVKNKIQLIWQTGKNFSRESIADIQNSPFVRIDQFINRMDLAYHAADLVVARAGAMTIAELKVLGKPGILIPYPFAAENHQKINAAEMVRLGAAVMIDDSAVKEQLVVEIQHLLNDEQKMREMGSNAAKSGTSNADDIIADEILKKITR